MPPTTELRRSRRGRAPSTRCAGAPRFAGGCSRTFAVAAALGLVPGLATSLAGQEYHVDLEADNVVRFVSRAPIEDFDGVTQRIDGYVLLDGQGVRAGDDFPGAELYFEVDLASLDTGIGLRNRHMRDNYLEVGEYPYAVFRAEIDRIESAPDGWRVTSSGTFAVHGVERARTLECLARPEGSGWIVSCAFEVRLSDHDIKRPRVMFLKLGEDIRVELEFHLDPAQEPR